MNLQSRLRRYGGHWRGSSLAALLALSLAWGVGCDDAAAPEDSSGGFNALDPSLVCPAGQKGWDFVTGGGLDEPVRTSIVTNQLTIVEATFGPNCLAGGKSPVSAGNWTSVWAADCNGKTECTRAGAKTGELTDPATGCEKDFRLRFTCGEDPFVYEQYVSKIKMDAPLTARCGDKITIVEGSYGANCQSQLKGNLTKTLVAQCSGLRSCYTNKEGKLLAPKDLPAYPASCGKIRSTSITYQCGSESEFRTLTFDNQIAAMGADLKPVLVGEPVNFDCPVTAVPSGKEAGIKVVDATYGDNCGAPSGNMAKAAEAACNGRNDCEFKVDPTTDPKFGCAKNFYIQYQCPDSGGDIKTVNIAAEALGKSATLTCPPKKYSNPQGIRIDEATYGANCASATIPLATLTNNAYTLATQTCLGKDTCDLALQFSADPALGCAKEFNLTYHCGQETQARVVKVDGEAGGKTVSLKCDPAVKVTSATWGGSCKLPEGNVTAAVATACDGKGGGCQFPILFTGGDPAPGCAKDFSVSYTCGPDPAVKTEKLTGEAGGKTVQLSCPMPEKPYERKACVPENCVGKERRNKDLKCVVDNTLTTLPLISTTYAAGMITTDRWGKRVGNAEATYPFRDSDDLSYTEDTVYNFSAFLYFEQDLDTALLGGKAVTTAALWVQDEFRLKTDTAGTGAAVAGFRCMVGTLDMRSWTAGDADAPSVADDPIQKWKPVVEKRRLKGTMAGVILPPTCFGAKVGSWADAAKRKGMSESEFRTKYSVSATSMKFAFDPKSKTVVLRNSTDTAATAAVANPIGFYYDAESIWVDAVSYYNQTNVPLPSANRKLTLSNELKLAADTVVVRDPEEEVSLFLTAPVPTLDVDFTWTRWGDSPGRNPYSPTPTPLAPNIQTMLQQNPGVTIEIALSDDLSDSAKKAPNGWVWSRYSLNLGGVGATKLGKGLPTGENVRLAAPLGEAFRQRLFRKTTDNYGWSSDDTTVVQKFRVRACLELDQLGRKDGDDSTETPLSVWADSGNTQFTLGFEKSKRCVLADQVIAIKRSFEYMPIPPSSLADSDDGVGNTLDSGNKKASNTADLGSMPDSTRPCKINQDCAFGEKNQTCVGASTTAMGSCSGKGPPTLFANTDRNTSEGGGAAQGNSSQITASGSYATLNGVATLTSKQTVKAMNFNIVDKALDGHQNWNNASGTWPKLEHKLKFDIDWDVVVALFGTTKLAQAINPVDFMMQGKKVAPGRMGIGIGIGKEFLLSIPPFIGVAGWSATAGIGLGAELTWDVSANTTYPCGKENATDTTACMVVFTSPKNFYDANKDCYARGGHLATARTEAEAKNLKTVNTATTETYWIGAQVSYKYPNASCAKSTTADEQFTANGCSASDVYYRWLTQPVKFATWPKGAALTVDAAQTGLTTDEFSEMTNILPTKAGLTHTYNVNTKTARVQAESMSATHPYICEFPAATSSQVKKFDVAGVISVGGGVNVRACTPSAVLGICISVGVNTTALEFEFARSFKTSHILQTLTGKMMKLGADSFTIKMVGTLLQGYVDAELHLVIVTTTYKIFEAHALQYNKQLYHHDFPVWRQDK